MNKEVVFARTLEQVKALAKEQAGCVSEAQVQEAFAPLKLDNAQMQMVYDYLVKHKVGIGEPLLPEDYLTPEERDYLQDYLDEIAGLPVYSEGEKEGYTIAAMAGDRAAQGRLVEIYLKDVVEVAKLYAGQGVYLEDLIGEGNVALAMGVTLLGSLEKPSQVQGMLGKCMMDAMEEYIAENASNEKKDRHIADKVNLVADKARELAEEFQRKVTVGELAKEAGLTHKSIRDAMRMSGFRIEDIEMQSDEEQDDAENSL